MKKLLSLIVLLLLGIGLSACGGASDSDGGTPSEDTTTEESTTVESASEGALDDCYVVIGDCSFTTDSDGNKVIVINYEYTNNGEDAESFELATMTYAYQDGVELERAYYVDDGSYDYDLAGKNVQPGTTFAVQKGFILTSDTSDILAEVEAYASFDETKLSKTFSQQ